MSVSDREAPEIRDWHAHIYFDSATRDRSAVRTYRRSASYRIAARPRDGRADRFAAAAGRATRMTP